MRGMIKKVLQMSFLAANNKDVTLRVTDPKEGLTAAEVQATMELITTLKVFTQLYPLGYEQEARLKGAKTVSTTTEDFSITVG